MLLSASRKSTQSLQMWSSTLHHMHRWSTEGLRSCDCPHPSLRACAIWISCIIFVSSSRATPPDGPLTTSVGTVPNSSHLHVSSVRPGISSFVFFPAPEPVVDDPPSFHSCHLSKWLRDAYIPSLPWPNQLCALHPSPTGDPPFLDRVGQPT